MAECSIAVFDLGGILIDWNPRYLYRKLFNGDSEAMEEFLATVCTQSWNEQQDAGRSFADGCASLKRELGKICSQTEQPHHENVVESEAKPYSRGCQSSTLFPSGSVNQPNRP